MFNDFCFCNRKSSEEAQRERRRISGLLNMMEPSLLQFYVSRQWLNKFKTFAEPGPISNNDFLCMHGGETVNVNHLRIICQLLAITVMNTCFNSMNLTTLSSYYNFFGKFKLLSKFFLILVAD